MGLTTGFIGGLTVTYTLAYLSLYIHRSNRLYQSTLLSQQKALLTSLYDPPEQEFEEPAYELRPAGLTEQLKDRWNRELETAVRNLQEKNWEEVRLRWESRVGNAWGRVKDSPVGGQVKGVGEQVAAAAGDAQGRANEVMKDVREKAGELGDQAKAKAVELGDQARVKAGEIGDAARVKAVELGDQAKAKAVETRDSIMQKSGDLKRDATVAVKEATGQKRLLEL